MDTPRRQARNKIAMALIVLGIVGIIISIMGYTRNDTPETTTPGRREAPAVSETKPDPKHVEKYTVAADLPKFIDIPAIEIKQARVMGIGQLADGEIVAPRNIYDAGWYTKSSKPGHPGAMFIYGHLSSWSAKGAFANLKKLRSGDTITITRGDDKTFTYRVEKTQSFPVGDVDMGSVLDPLNPGQHGLNLMTCDGKVIKDTNDFTHRLVVYTSLVN